VHTVMLACASMTTIKVLLCALCVLCGEKVF
jgi:hypothetical protein